MNSKIITSEHTLSDGSVVVVGPVRGECEGSFSGVASLDSKVLVLL